MVQFLAYSISSCQVKLSEGIACRGEEIVLLSLEVTAGKLLESFGMVGRNKTKHSKSGLSILRCPANITFQTLGTLHPH